MPFTYCVLVPIMYHLILQVTLIWGRGEIGIVPTLLAMFVDRDRVSLRGRAIRVFLLREMALCVAR